MAAPNPFTPPGAKVEDRPDLSPGSPVKAVAAGAFVDIAATVAGGTLLSVAYAATLALSGASAEETASHLLRQYGWTPFTLMSMGIGGAASMLGGYVCARIAKRDEGRLGWVLAGVSVILGLVFTGDEVAFVLDQVIVGALVTVIGVLAGTRLATARNRRAGA